MAEPISEELLEEIREQVAPYWIAAPHERAYYREKLEALAPEYLDALLAEVDRLRAELALALCRGGALEPEPEDGERASELKAALEARVGRSVRVPLVDVQDPAAERVAWEREEKGDG